MRIDVRNILIVVLIIINIILVGYIFLGQNSGVGIKDDVRRLQIDTIITKIDDINDLQILSKDELIRLRNQLDSLITFYEKINTDTLSFEDAIKILNK